MSPVERIQKILADRGLASRRKAEEWIREGRVTVNGRVAVIGEKADPERDALKVDGRRLAAAPEKLFVLFYKPKNVVTTASDPEGRTTVLDLLSLPKPRLFPVGRLDYDAEGLILLTNDGDLAHRLAHPSHEIPRTYWVKVKGKPEREEVQRLGRGVRLEDGMTAPCIIKPLRETEGNVWMEMTLREGKNRQVKRMWEKMGYPVLKLKRVAFAGLKLGALQPGHHRLLSPVEVRKLKETASLSAGRTPFPAPPAPRRGKRRNGEGRA
jgi:23S rRNA pseudouridine2605 synthase